MATCVEGRTASREGSVGVSKRSNQGVQEIGEHHGIGKTTHRTVCFA